MATVTHACCARVRRTEVSHEVARDTAPLPQTAGDSGGIFVQHAGNGHPGGQRRRLPRRRVLRAAPAATSAPASNPGATRQGNLSCWRKTAAEADCGLPSGGADYADTICLNHDAIVAGRIDRGATNGLTRGSAMFCTVAAYRGVLQLKFNGNYRNRPIKSLVHSTFSFLNLVVEYLIKV